MPPDEGGSRPRFLLLGSGEFEPWAGEAERFAMAGASGDGSVAVVATASAREGQAVYERWTAMGLAHYEALGIKARPLHVQTAADAKAPHQVKLLDDVSMVFFSGGSPGYLARTVAGTPFWDSVKRLVDRGGVFAGCSAGAMIAGAATAPGQVGRLPFPFGNGLGLLPTTAVGVHWDALAGWWIRWLRDLAPRRLPAGIRFFGVAEHTAIATDGEAWAVFGAGAVDVRDGGARRLFTAGQRFPG